MLKLNGSVRRRGAALLIPALLGTLLAGIATAAESE